MAQSTAVHRLVSKCMAPQVCAATILTHSHVELAIANFLTASVVYWSEFLATDPEDPGSIRANTRFSEKQCVWNEVHSAS
jgi:hypothetical protein